ncbi:peptide/nickel transport system permease protein [Psychromicrobium silvestre]|uniref:Oligopeptide transport system permease protein OppC n=1 Tax=Psychromicrobium silvestre TaxID=1645614 RepID=A0A7Y9LUB7_9MICC|nr:ABC transporter permease [Psychromicrobium silvestre]NYE95769.1 peptide/nickel transport system permease protein [Psychromicrobium silvestre]
MTTMNVPDPVEIDIEKSMETGDEVISKTRIIVRRFMRNKTAVAGLVIFILLCLFSTAGVFLQKWDKTTLDVFNIGTGPSADHWFGTTQSGRDLFAQMVEGLRTSILIGLIVGAGATLIAAIYGCTMAYFGGRTMRIMLFILETLIMVPSILIVAIVTSGGGGLKDNIPGWVLLTIVLLVFGWMAAARLIRSLGQSLMTREFVKAAQFMGVPPLKIVWRHLVPNIGSLLVLELTRGVTFAILSEVAFSFIGIGIKDPDVSLGVLIGQSTAQISSYPWMFWFPLIAMFFLTGSLSMMNDGLRDAFDPNSTSVGQAKKKKK